MSPIFYIYNQKLPDIELFYSMALNAAVVQYHNILFLEHIIFLEHTSINGSGRDKTWRLLHTHA